MTDFTIMRSTLSSSRRTCVLLLLMTVFFIQSTIGQRNARTKLSDLSDPELLELAMYINEWLDAPVVAEHVAEFSLREEEDSQGNDVLKGGLHTTHNFLGWHRVYIRILEDFLLTKPNGSKYVPLPEWEPISPNNEDQPIPSYFNGLEPDGINAYPNYIDPDAINLIEDPQNQTLMFIDNFNAGCLIEERYTLFLNNYCNNGSGSSPLSEYCFPGNENLILPLLDDHSDPGDFSDFLERGYHGAGHGAVSGAMTDPASPAALVFWVWHAAVDDWWYKWERDCISNNTFTRRNSAPISGEVHWSGNVNSEEYVKGEVIINSGGHLVIDPGVTVYFHDSQYSDQVTRIHIKPGGKLTVNSDAVLSGIEIFGEGGGHVPNENLDLETYGYDPTGVVYNTPWDGIKLEDGGEVELISATIQHARTAIENQGAGGLITATGSDFINNRRDIVLGTFSSFNKYNSSQFIGCTFKNNEPLRDMVWQSGLIGADERRFYQFRTPHVKLPLFPLNHVELYSVSGLNFSNCVFENEPSIDGTEGQRSRGIYSFASGFLCRNTSFTSFKEGINSSTFFEWNPTNYPRVLNCAFDDNIKGIVLVSAELALVENCVFNIPAQNEIDPATKPLGISAKAGSGFRFLGNTFQTPGTPSLIENKGIWVRNSCEPRSNWITANTFLNTQYGVETESGNPNLQIRCNSFNGFGNDERYAIAVSSGDLADQGDCFTVPAGNTWDHSLCTTVKSQIFKDAGAQSFLYRAHSDLLPANSCISTGVGVVNCGYTSETNSCEEIILFDPKNEQGREDYITLLTTNINGTSNPSRLAELERTRLTETYHGMLDKIDANQPSAAYQYMKLKHQQGIPVPERDLASLAMETGNFSEAATYISQMDVNDPKRSYMEAVYAIRLDGRGPGQLTSSEVSLLKHDPSGPPTPCSSTPYQEYLEFGEESVPQTLTAAPNNIEQEYIDKEGFDLSATSKVSQLIVYPNPTPGLLEVQWQSEYTEEEVLLIVLNSVGKVVWSTKVPNSGQTSLSLKHLPSGIYVLRSQIRDSYQSQKFIIAH